MKSVIVTGPGSFEVQEVPMPEHGPTGALIRMRACGICGSDGYYITIGGIPPLQGATPLGHEPVGEIVAVGDQVQGLKPGDHVVVNPIGPGSGRIGSGGPQGALSEYLTLEDAELGRNLTLVSDEVPWEIAALVEPMSVARHAVNRTGVKPGDKVAIFGAGPIGLGAAIGFKLSGAASVVVIDVLPTRLEKALAVGADAAINSAEEDVAARLTELHGTGTTAMGKPRAGTDIYLDAAGVPAVIDTALAAAKQHATLGIVAVHKKPVEVDFGAVLDAEVNIVTSMGYPTEIFQVAEEISAHWQRFSPIVSDVFTFAEVEAALAKATTPGAADKVVVTFD
jgi:threonine dehydrogenase-like Zn-dependent dehydrogenase